MDRLKNRAKVITAEERSQQQAIREAEKKRLIDESEERKRKFKELEKNKVVKKGSESLRNTDEGVILDKAFMAKQEQEEEIKIANRVILTTKCQVIRDAQIAEKNEIERELRDENIRLEKMMNEDRENALKHEDKKRDHFKKINERHALEIKVFMWDRFPMTPINPHFVFFSRTSSVKEKCLKFSKQNALRMKQKQWERLKSQLLWT